MLPASASVNIDDDRVTIGEGHHQRQGDVLSDHLPPLW